MPTANNILKNLAFIVKRNIWVSVLHPKVEALVLNGTFDNETKEGSGIITIEYVLQDDGTRNFDESIPADVDAQQKITTTWAELKRN
jgi:hypothetical protein